MVFGGMGGYQKVRTYQRSVRAYALRACGTKQQSRGASGSTAPIVQGPFGSGLSAVDLVVAVSEGGGLGSFGVHHLDGAGIRDVAAEIRARTSRARSR